MDDDLAARINNRLKQAKSKRLEVEDLLDDCYRYAVPGRTRFNSTRAGGGEDDIYDETAVVALEDYASVVHSRMTPDNAQWVTLTCDDSIDPRDKAAVDRDLAEINDAIFKLIHSSNFSAEAQESYIDLGCSTGVMITSWADGGLRHASVPLTQGYLEAGADDSVGGLFRVRSKVRAELIPAMYPDAEFDAETERVIAREPDKPVEVTDAIWREYGGNADGRSAVLVKGLGGGRNGSVIINDPLVGMGSMPFVAYRFSKASGELYGRGALMKVLSGVKTTNLVVELMLQNAAMSLVGLYQYDDDATLNASTVQLVPGAMIPRAPGSRGMERVDVGGREFSVAGLILDEQRRNIKAGMYTDALGDPNRSPMKATEVVARTQELAGRISANIGRLRGEMIQPYIRRVLYLAEKAGRIELPIPMKNVVITPDGPLARAMRQQNGDAVMMLFQALAGMYGPMVAAAHFDMGKVADLLREAYSAPLHAYPEQAKMEQQVGAALQMMAQQMQGAPA